MSSIPELVEARLLAQAPDLTSIEIVEDIEAIALGTAPKSGSCFVAWWKDNGEENEIATGGFEQTVLVEFNVAIVIRTDDDLKGRARFLKLEALKTSVELALAGWQPRPECKPMSFVGAQGGRLPQRNCSVLVQTWETSRFLTGE